MTRGACAVTALALLGCATAGPSSPAEAYARALEAGQLDAAYALTSPSFRAQVSADAFRTRFSDSAARAARAQAVRDGLAELTRSAPELFGEDRTEAPEAVILRFVSSVRGGQFEQAWRCLSEALRARYTVQLLARDFHAEPTAEARLQRAVLAAEGTPLAEGPRVRFPVPGGGAVVVLREADGWKLEALE